MNTYTMITTLAVLLSTASLTLGLPQATTALAEDRSVFYPWSNHPDCAAPATACKTDCTQAVKNLCQQDLGLRGQVDFNYINETVGECTVSYIYRIGNTLPDSTQCYNTFAYINDAGKPGPDGCGGTFGGAFGWAADGTRTKDPIYVIQPKSGNPNCFMPPDKPADKPLAVDELPDGTTVPELQDEKCPSAISRRENGGCIAGTVGVWAGCTAACVAVGVFTFGIGAPLATLFCTTCAGAAIGFERLCETKLTRRQYELTPRLLLDAGSVLLDARADPTRDMCKDTDHLPLCPVARTKLLAFHKCPGTGETGGSMLGGGDSGINF